MRAGNFAKGLSAAVSIPIVIGGVTVATWTPAGLKFATGKGLIGSDGSPALTLGADGEMSAFEDLIFTAGKGINFGAYVPEVGNWDAAFLTGGGTITISEAGTTCIYTKIGDLVTVQGAIYPSAVDSPTGTLHITGMPYASISTAPDLGVRCAGSLYMYNLVTGVASTVSLTIEGAASTQFLISGGGESAEENLAAEVDTGTRFNFSLTYMT